jgi:hypothetical protein
MKPVLRRNARVVAEAVATTAVVADVVAIGVVAAADAAATAETVAIAAIAGNVFLFLPQFFVLWEIHVSRSAIFTP